MGVQHFSEQGQDGLLGAPQFQKRLHDMDDFIFFGALARPCFFSPVFRTIPPDDQRPRPKTRGSDNARRARHRPGRPRLFFRGQKGDPHRFRESRLSGKSWVAVS